MSKYCKNCYKEKIDSLIKDEDLSYYEEAEKCDGCGEIKLLVKVDNIPNQNEINKIENENLSQAQTVQESAEEVEGLTIAECNCETQKHIELVRKYIRYITDKLTSRGVNHDASKLVSPEVEVFAKYTPLLAKLTFGTDEYNQCLENMSVALKCHYSQNNHHPEHWPNGINDMSLVDVVEMVCDWKASSERQNDGNILQTIDVLAERFNINKQLKQIIKNTVKLFEDLK